MRAAPIRTALAALLVGPTAMPASAQPTQQPAGFYQDHGRGWFWYEIEPEEPEPPEPEEPKLAPQLPSVVQTPAPLPAPDPVPAQPTLPAFGSAAWLRENLPKYRDRALDDPSPENVRAYYVLQRLTMDKAQAFTDMAQRVVIGDPLLDEVGRRPTATYGANEMNRVAGEATDKELGAIAQTVGIWFFFRSDCAYCHQQATVMEMLARTAGFSIVPISLDGRPLPGGQFPDFKVDRGQAAQLAVERTPTIVLVKPPDGFVTIARGMLSLQELKRRILTGALNAGWIDEGSFARTRPVDTGPMLPATLQPPQETLASPEDLVAYLRSQVRRTP